MLGVIDDHKQITTHSKRYIKFSHYIFRALSALLIHQICKLFAICSLRTIKIYFNFPAEFPWPADICHLWSYAARA